MGSNKCLTVGWRRCRYGNQLGVAWADKTSRPVPQYDFACGSWLFGHFVVCTYRKNARLGTPRVDWTR